MFRRILRRMLPPTLVYNIRVAEPDISPASLGHISGVRMGNEPGAMTRNAGIRRADSGARGTARRSTGIQPRKHNAILPDLMPNWSPG